MAADKDGLTGKLFFSLPEFHITHPLLLFFFFPLDSIVNKRQQPKGVAQIKGYNPVTFNHDDLGVVVGGLVFYTRS